MFCITSELKLYEENITDENMLKKIFSIFYASNLLLQQQYRECDYKKIFKINISSCCGIK
jgi:hypothetical protein